MLDKLTNILQKKYPKLVIEYHRNAGREYILVRYKTKDSVSHWVMTLYNDRIIYWAGWADHIRQTDLSSHTYAYDTRITYITPADPNYFEIIEAIIQEVTDKVRRYHQC